MRDRPQDTVSAAVFLPMSPPLHRHSTNNSPTVTVWYAAPQEDRAGAIQSRFEEKIARSEQLRQAHLAAVAHRAGDEARKVIVL